ncbi:GAF domain-containing hybrid sensor histidine kinase/response regulator [Desulfobulbus alkaliphilus]|uniref:GAF domain-containing hybrid sensor histidine kinase/response regulator n=1 Tax=Desulfobulbus alkaliphilus TaxID=869814 RepID=UPI001965518A|nr:PAS domain S-box protein [Desulfobulbus alkaliphilus]MBM9538625.1 PAS domain S-box protein [Desulfobulbus alkaliphilus]
MTTYRDETEILYEISLSVGTSLELEEMLRTTISTMLRLLNCSGAQVLQAIHQKNSLELLWQPIVSIPQPIVRNRAHQLFIEAADLPTLINDWADWATHLPIEHQEQGKTRLLFHLPGFGALALEKNGVSFGSSFTLSLQELLNKLAHASLACLDAIERRRAEEQLRRRRLYEHLLLSDILTKAVNVDDVEMFQAECLSLLGHGLTVSRVALYEYRLASQMLVPKYTWCADGATGKTDQTGQLHGLGDDSAPWFLESLRHGDTVNFVDIENLPEPTVRDFFQQRNARSILVVPLFVQGNFFGCLGLEDCFNRRDWLEEDVAILLSIGRIIDGVTGRKRMEQALRDSEKRFRILLQNVPAIAVQSYDLDGRIRYWNKASEQLYGYSAEEAIGCSLFDLIIPTELQEMVRQDFRNMALNGRTIAPTELSLVRKDGTRVPVLTSNVFIEMTGCDPELFSFDVDLTEIKKAEEERQQLQSQLTQARKMESVGRLAGGVAHDFNNMLSVILGHTEMTLAKIDPASRICSHFKAIQKAAEHSADITSQLLAFARKQTVIPKVLDLNEVVEETLSMLRRLIGENINLDWRPGEHLNPIKIDPSQINQVLVNLCVNARDAIVDQGRIVIETSSVFLDETYCATHNGAVPDEYVQLIVSDNGKGMDQETMANIFEPFFTTKEVGEGTGLGLATIYGIIKQNNRIIEVMSDPGQGTRFIINLPRHVENTEQPVGDQADSISTTEHRGQATILLVEDQPDMLELVTLMLEGQGYTVLATSSPGQAIQLAESHPDQIDLLMTDVIMPEMNGRILSQKIQALFPNIKYLFMSGYSANVIAHHGVLDPAIPFIEKPFSKTTLGNTITQVLGRD